ncbi:hypothetical protein QP027_09285 [Corynebacterium breve]|uniref:Uncharacterized protein n=1 Tax=Corynebacterium breve TaxID=3049799 RepID=A0ABY8VDW0_9CORY|nr:hypothetical protein [Corynebacterium breve]WIM67292.1 hypothetical protein QP027_09285 [Corynebacterium breve]
MLNNLATLKLQLQALGEVNLHLGIRWAAEMLLIAVFGCGSLAFGGAMAWNGILGNLPQDAPNQEGGFGMAERPMMVLMGAFFFLLGVLMILGLAPSLRPSYLRAHWLKVNWTGIYMAGVLVPWQMIREIDLYRVSHGRLDKLHMQFVLASSEEGVQAVWPDDTRYGRVLAQAVNEKRTLFLYTHSLNVRPKVLLAFLLWVQEAVGDRSGPHASDSTPLS